MTLTTIIAGALSALMLGSAVLAQPIAENTGPNATIVRTVTGKMAFRVISDGRYRGGEDFRLLVYPDGSRQMQISKDFLAVNAQQTIVARVDARFRPLETFAAYWTPEGYKGSIFVTVAGNTLRAFASGPKGVIEDIRDVPDAVVVVHHGEIMNGWYLWPDFEKPTAGGQSGTTLTYNLNAAPRGDAQVSGIVHDGTYTRIGHERVTTPAGTFDTIRYKLANLELWVADDADRLLVRQTDIANDREYVLTELHVSGER